jgi:hypothetical protein
MYILRDGILSPSGASHLVPINPATTLFLVAVYAADVPTKLMFILMAVAFATRERIFHVYTYYYYIKDTHRLVYALVTSRQACDRIGLHIVWQIRPQM